MRPTLHLSVLLAGLLATLAPAQDRVQGRLITFQDNGAWSWFEDERAVVDVFANRLLVGSCADGSGIGGSARSGDIDVAALDLRSGRISSFELYDRLQGDDHNSPALLVRPDGRYLAMYGMHGGSGTAPLLSRWRVSLEPGDPTRWGPEQSFRHSRAMSYSNLHHLPDARGGQGVIYNFVRGTNFDPNVMVSTDLGATFTGAGKLLTEGGNGDRPYVKYANDGSSRVHLITTERHPRNYLNSIYHGFVENGALHDSFGNVVDPNILDASGQPPARLTPVFRNGTVLGGVTLNRTWTVDLDVDPSGHLRALFLARANDQDTDHRLLLGRFDGSAWSVNEVCRMGGYLYSPENDYTGLGALHPEQTERLFVATDIDPRDGSNLAHYEIFDGSTADGGSTWVWQPVTSDSTVDNLRPIVPAWSANRTALLWFRGTYRTYTDYDAAVVGIVDAPELPVAPITYIDAVPTNTTRTDGTPAPTTGPAAGPGPADGRWHLRTGFGNGGSVWTSDESGSEDVPALRMRVPAAAGRHDVYAFLWSNPGEDWLLRAGLDQSALRIFEKRGVEAAIAADFAQPVTLTGSTVVLYKAWLGRVDLPAAGHVDVFIDDLASGQSGDSRCWFDGIGLAPVVTPATLDEVGSGCGGPPGLTVTGTPRLGSAGLTLQVTGGPPQGVAALLFGTGALRPFDLSSFGFPGCSLLPQPLEVLPLGTLTANGSSPSLVVPIPSDPRLMELRVGFQGVVTTPSGALGLTATRVGLLGF